MAIQPVYESIRLNQKEKISPIKIKLDCKTEIPSDTAVKVLDVSVFTGYPQVSVNGGKMEIFGRAIFNVIYVNVDGATVKTECYQEYSFETDVKDSICGVTADIEVEKTDFDLAGTKLVLSAYLCAHPKVFCDKEISYLSSGENAIVETIDKTYSKSYGVRQGVFPVEEEFELDYEIAEVLSQKASAIITSVQCGVGCVIIDGEATVSALLLQNVEKSDIIKENKVLPFRVELEYEEAMPAFLAVASCNQKSLKSDVSVDPEKGNSVVAINLSLSFEAEVFSEETVSLVRDAFSLTEITETENGECEYFVPSEVRSCKAKLIGRANAEIPVDCTITAVGGEKVEITEIVPEPDGLKIIGVLSLKAYLKDGEGKVGTQVLEAPFEEKLECVVCDGGDISLKVIVYDGQARIITPNEVEITAGLSANAYFSQKRTINYVKNLKAIREKEVCTSAISVYIPMEGEELWSLSKRLNVSPETLIQTNKDLNFPLTGKERIVIYRQK